MSEYVKFDNPWSAERSEWFNSPWTAPDHIKIISDNDPPSIKGNEKDGQLSKDRKWIFFASLDEPKDGEERKEGKWIKVPSQKEVDKIYKDIRRGIAKAKLTGKKIAAYNLERWLDGTGGHKTEDLDWLRDAPSFNNAVQFNNDRFIDLKNSKGKSLEIIAEGLDDNTSATHSDFWDHSFYPYTTYIFSDAGTDPELYYAWGGSAIHSDGSFSLSRNGDKVSISGIITHKWYDDYNWEPGLYVELPEIGKVYDYQLKYMEFYKGAKPFSGSVTWKQKATGVITIGTLYNDIDMNYVNL